MEVWHVLWPGPGKLESNDMYFQLSYYIKDAFVNTTEKKIQEKFEKSQTRLGGVAF